MWETMSRLYFPQWSKTYGEVGGVVFQDWARELLPYGSQGVLQGLREIREAGNAYVPPLAKFLSLCRNSREDSKSGRAKTFSEELHGGYIKPTPNGLPLTWTQGKYSVQDLRDSGTFEDGLVADDLENRGEAAWQYQVQS